MITDEEIENHNNTTKMRYSLRPAIVNTYKNLDYYELIKEIRWQMIHGAGCKGPRINTKHHYDYDSSENEFLSVVVRYYLARRYF